MIYKTLSEYKMQRLSFSLVTLIVGVVLPGFGFSDIGYVLTTLSFLGFLPFFRRDNLKDYTPKVKVIAILITLYNVLLFFQMFFTPSSQGLATIVLSPCFFQAILVFSFLFFDDKCLPYIVKSLPKLFPTIILLAIFKFESIPSLVVLLSLLLLVFGDNIQKSKFKLHIIWVAIFLLGILMFAIGIRFHFLAISLLTLLHFITSFISSFKKIIWIGIVSLPFVFTISLFVFDTSILDPSTYAIDNDDDKLSDSRSFLYVETIDYLEKEGKLWTGVGVLGGIRSYALLKYDSTISGDGKRQFVEANSLELMRRGGLIYFLLYLSLFGIASYQALKVKNKYIQNMGLLLATVFLFSLIDIPVFMEPITICYFIILGVSANKRVRSMSEEQFVLWIKSCK